ncbi:VOC family protein [Domibacillus sp. A3M-37]|uniref:VOC family protein n=1 Tax=Domibacillus sp. A3M-37 TaxID=2962037 RepID=UPI0020B8EB07|nr:VOC family protein [Domibacillus sp. A3M-37]MCP3765043.1 VOC family protein [Domibacillus sp. A3M-37]
MKLRLELFVENIEKSIEFYRDVLEFNVSKEADKDYVPVEHGDVILGLGGMKNLPEQHPLKVNNHNQKNGLGIEIVLEVEDINAFYSKIVSKGYPIETGLSKKPWGLEDFRLMDPDGYYLRITSIADE